MIAIMSNILLEGLARLSERDRDLASGEVLFRGGDLVLSLFLVAAGTLRLTRSLPDGLQLTLQRAGRGAILAEASLFAATYHCEAVAIERSVVRVVPRPRIEAALARSPHLARAWARHLAQEVQRMRTLAEILSLKTVAQRVDAWLALEAGGLPPKGHWRQVASEIGVTAEALYRELARRRRADRPLLQHPQ